MGTGVGYFTYAQCLRAKIKKGLFSGLFLGQEIGLLWPNKKTKNVSRE